MTRHASSCGSDERAAKPQWGLSQYDGCSVGDARIITYIGNGVNGRSPDCLTSPASF
jgi:hypothetical protein